MNQDPVWKLLDLTRWNDLHFGHENAVTFEDSNGTSSEFSASIPVFY